MKLKKFKEKDNKRIGIIVFTIVCILLVSGVILYRTFAIFEVRTNQNVIKGTVQDPGNIYFAFYVDDEIQKDMPQKNGEYIFDEENSYCGVTGGDERDDTIQLEFDKDRWSITVLGLKTSRTKCNLKFVSGAYILDKPIKAVTSGDGLYKVTHSDNLLEDGFKKTEYRYAGSNPYNYINFNCDETGAKCELWRIIGLVNVMTSDNTVEQRVKIIRDESIGSYAWDNKQAGQGSSTRVEGSNDWTDSQLMEVLNGIYYEGATESCYQGTKNATICDFGTTSKTKGLSETARNIIDKDIIWNIGGWKDSKVKTAEMYGYERGKNVYNNNPTTWSYDNTKKPAISQGESTLETGLFHGVGLMYPSDYGYAVGGTNRNTCLTTKNLDEYNNEECKNNNWLILGLDEWFLSTDFSDSYVSFMVYSGGNVSHRGNISYHANVRPTLYLNPNVKIQNDEQDGSELKPFNLTLETTE